MNEPGKSLRNNASGNKSLSDLGDLGNKSLSDLGDLGDSDWGDELADSGERTTSTLRQFDATVLTNPILMRAAGGITVSVLVLAWPNRTTQVLGRLVGVALVWLVLSSVRSAIANRRSDWFAILVAVAGIASGLFLIFTPERSRIVLGRLMGAVAVGLAVHIAFAAVRSTGTLRGRRLPIAALATAGALLLLRPEQALSMVATLTAIAWLLVSFVVVAVMLDPEGKTIRPGTGSLAIATDWLRDRPKSVDARQTLYDKILYDGDNAGRRVIRFFALMGFASVIASMGVLTDSTAVVIGAMLIAPLMTPLMGMAISLVMGWPNRLGRSALIAVAGILFAIGIGVLLGLTAPAVINTATNTQILARVNPTILDLVTALAAGAAGAYGLSRPDVSDSLPGVAIAISLVPPLSVVGVAYSQGDWSSGNGALLLFLTNMIAILIMGGLTFILTGVTPIARVAENQRRVRTSIGAVVAVAIVVTGALILNGTQAAANLFEQSEIDSVAQEWLPDSPDHGIASVAIDGDTIRVVVVGPADGLPSIEALADDMSAALNRSITVELRLVVEERLSATGESGN